MRVNSLVFIVAPHKFGERKNEDIWREREREREVNVISYLNFGAGSSERAFS